MAARTQRRDDLLGEAPGPSPDLAYRSVLVTKIRELEHRLDCLRRRARLGECPVDVGADRKPGLLRRGDGLAGRDVVLDRGVRRGARHELHVQRAKYVVNGLGQLGSDRNGTNSSSARANGRSDWPTAKDMIDAGLQSPLVGRHQIGDRIDGLPDGRRVMGGADDE
jgi:hypothetical protein